MDQETLNKANRLISEMTGIQGVLSRIDNNMPMVDISFSNGGFCCSNHSNFLPKAEVLEIISDITGRIRQRAQDRLDELQQEFNNL